MLTKLSIQSQLDKIGKEMDKEVLPSNIPFSDFLKNVSSETKTLRNIFQLVHDMIDYYVPAGHNEYPNDPESINYIKYDCSDLFIKKEDNPFFADRLLANQLVNVFHSLRQGPTKNKMLVFVGPPGSGKSTFLNSFLNKLEQFTRCAEGAMYETVWELDVEKLGLNIDDDFGDNDADIKEMIRGNKLIVPCPNHDHPILQIPKDHRSDLLDSLIQDETVKKHIFTRKEYQWLFESEPCIICSSLKRYLSEKVKTKDLLSMLHVKRYAFNRRRGEGISVYNPGDEILREPLGNYELQRRLDLLFKSSDAVEYLYSDLAKTNNGVMAIMDVKLKNVERLKILHGIISDGIHKVTTYEETINSLFITLINPEDLDKIEKRKSFQDRMTRVQIPYVRDYSTEVEIYRNTYGKRIDQFFLPHVLNSFARIIVASRLSELSVEVSEWIADPHQYEAICDRDLLLLQMEMYVGNIPIWLSNEDLNSLNRDTRRKIINEGELQGKEGISGRESISLFNSFYYLYRQQEPLISINDVLNFFQDKKYENLFSNDFLEALQKFYDFNLLQEIKESLFYYNEEQIQSEILDYFFCINNELGSTIESPRTKKKITVNQKYFDYIEKLVIGANITPEERKLFREDIQARYITKTLNEVRAGKDIKTTSLFKELFAQYKQSLKQDVLAPLVENNNFRLAIKDFKTPEFKNYDKRIQNDVEFLINNLIETFKYTETGARQVCIYTLDNELLKKFPDEG